MITTDGIIERLKKICDSVFILRLRGDDCVGLNQLVDDIINTRNKADITRTLVKALHALQEFEWKQRLQPVDEVQKALAAIEGLLEAEVFLGPASLKAPSPKYPWERPDAYPDQATIMHALSILERESAIHPNKVAVEKHTRFEVNYNTLADGNVFYVDIQDIHADRFLAMANRLPRHSAKVFKVEAVKPDYDQLISTYKAIFAAYLEGEFGELMRGSGRSVQDGKNAWHAAVSRLRGHLGVSDSMVPDIIDGVTGFQKFQERLAKVNGRLDLTTILKTQEKAKLLWGEASRASLRGPDGEEIPIRVGPTYQQPIEPVGRPGDLLSVGPNGLTWRSPTSDGRIDPTIFGAVRPIRI